MNFDSGSLNRYLKNFLIIVMIITIIVISVFSYFSLDALVTANIVSKKMLIFLVIAAFVSSIVFGAFLITFIISKMREDRQYISELKDFKDFADALYHVNTENEIYQLLQTCLFRFKIFKDVKIFYWDETCQNELTWHKLCDQETPICLPSTRKCPIIKSEQDLIVESIGKTINCACYQPIIKIGSYMCLLLLNEQNSKAILQVYSEREHIFNEELVSRLKSYVEITKAFLKSKRLVTNYTKAAETDKLTGLWNRAKIDSVLDYRLSLASATNKPVSLIMADIDFFKRINDTYGHDVGDQVLVVFSKAILNSIRKTDVAGRYGGEEFIIILPDTSTKVAEIIAERMRTLVSDTNIYISNNKSINITCSLGISTYPMLSDSKESLKKTADIALYKAKESGRNRVVVYSETKNETIENSPV